MADLQCWRERGKKINKRDCWCWYAPFFLFLFFEFTTSKFVKCVVCQVNKAFFLSIKVRFGLGVSVYKSTFFFSSACTVTSFTM